MKYKKSFLFLPLLACCINSSAGTRADAATAAADAPGELAAAERGAPPRALRLPPATPIAIDGRLDEAAWSQAGMREQFVQLQPRDRQAARWRTTFQILVDDGALIFGIRAFDPDPAAIRAPLVRRDQVSRNQDYVAVYIDPIGRRRNAQFVRVSASGIVADGTYSAQDASEDLASDFDIQAAAQRLPDGYSVEIRIPFTELRYPLEGGLPWRVMVARSVPRAENALWVSVPLTSDALHWLTAMQPIDGIEDMLDRMRERGFMRLRPELTYRRTDATSARGVRSGDRDLTASASVKWRPRADWVIDAMVNPDFSQVELDTPQLSRNVRYALYQTEKRPFFLESLDVTGQGQGDDDGAARGLAGFYSRSLANPKWGLRATWRGTRSEATMLTLRDKGGGTVLRPYAYGTEEAIVDEPSNASFMRGQWQLPGMSAAALLSTRTYGEGRHNHVGGGSVEGSIGANWRWRVQGLLSATTAQLDDDGNLRRGDTENGHYVWVDLQQRSEQWASRLHLEQISPSFTNDNGFVNKSGVRRASYEVNRRLGTMPLGWFEADEFEFQLSVQDTRAMEDPRHGVRGGERVDRSISPGLWFSGPRALDAWLHANAREIRNGPGGRMHDERTIDFGFAVNPGARLSTVRFEWEGGRLLDVDADRVVDGATGKVSMLYRTPLPGGWSLELSPLASWSLLDRPQGGRSLKETARRLLAVLQLNAEESIKLIAQRQDAFRAEEPGLLDGERRDSRTRSLMYTRLQPQGAFTALGVTDVRSRPGRARQTEWFLKYRTDFWL